MTNPTQPQLDPRPPTLDVPGPQLEAGPVEDIEVGITIRGKMVVRMIGGSEMRLNRQWAERLHERIGKVIEQMPNDQAEARLPVSAATTTPKI